MLDENTEKAECRICRKQTLYKDIVQYLDFVISENPLSMERQYGPYCKQCSERLISEFEAPREPIKRSTSLW